MLELAKYTH